MTTTCKTSGTTGNRSKSIAIKSRKPRLPAFCLFAYFFLRTTITTAPPTRSSAKTAIKMTLVLLFCGSDGVLGLSGSAVASGRVVSCGRVGSVSVCSGSVATGSVCSGSVGSGTVCSGSVGVTEGVSASCRSFPQTVQYCPCSSVAVSPGMCSSVFAIDSVRVSSQIVQV